MKHKKIKSKQKIKQRPLKSQRVKTKEFEPFKMTSAYGKFMSGFNTNSKFRTTMNSNTGTDNTTPSLPVWTSRGVVPTALPFEMSSDGFHTKSSHFMSPRRDERLLPKPKGKIKHKNFKNNKNISENEEKKLLSKQDKKLQLYLPGLKFRDVSPKLFSKLSLNSFKNGLPNLK